MKKVMLHIIVMIKAENLIERVVEVGTCVNESYTQRHNDNECII
jgi:hypothetical protein